MTVTITDIISNLLSFLALATALYIGVIQNKINKRLLLIQDNVDIYLRINNLIDNDDQSNIIASKIEVRNISATPLTLEKYIFNGVERIILPYRIPPASQFSDANYYINLPPANVTDYVSFILYFEDSMQSKLEVHGRVEFKNGNWEPTWEKPRKIKE